MFGKHSQLTNYHGEQSGCPRCGTVLNRAVGDGYKCTACGTEYQPTDNGHDVLTMGEWCRINDLDLAGVLRELHTTGELRIGGGAAPAYCIRAVGGSLIGRWVS